jgi:hypothetical protein
MKVSSQCTPQKAECLSPAQLPYFVVECQRKGQLSKRKGHARSDIWFSVVQDLGRQKSLKAFVRERLFVVVSKFLSSLDSESVCGNDGVSFSVRLQLQIACRLQHTVRPTAVFEGAQAFDRKFERLGSSGYPVDW